MTEKDMLVPIPEDQDQDLSFVMLNWQALAEGLPEHYADWLPFMVFGVPYADIARIFGIHKSTITKALTNNKDFARAVSQGRRLVKRQLHYVWLDQRAVSAWKNVGEYLNIDPMEKDEKGRYVIEDRTMRLALMKEKAKMSRFVLQQLGLHVQRVEVTHNSPPPMFMGDATLANIVIERVQKIMDGEDGDIVQGEYKKLGDGKPMEPMEDEEALGVVYKERSKHTPDFKDEY